MISWPPLPLPLPLLLLFLIASTSSLKQGNFGIFTACTVNQTLRLECRYAACPNSPPFDCKMKTSDGLPLPDPLPDPFENCTLPLLRHRALHANAPTSYNCTLTRKGRREELRIVIDYSVAKGRGHIKACKDTSGAPPHRAPPLLGPAAVLLSLWAVLGAA